MTAYVKLLLMLLLSVVVVVVVMVVVMTTTTMMMIIISVFCNIFSLPAGPFDRRVLVSHRSHAQCAVDLGNRQSAQQF